MLKDHEARSKLGTPGRSDLGLMGVDWEERINHHLSDGTLLRAN